MCSLKKLTDRNKRIDGKKEEEDKRRMD